MQMRVVLKEVEAAAVVVQGYGTMIDLMDCLIKLDIQLHAKAVRH